ncbi:MAG: class I SAM-dependent methyltransferase, partial [Candidatus Binatia bacterium]
NSTVRPSYRIIEGLTPMRTRIDYFVKRHLRSLGDLSGKVVIDVPAGAGIMSRVLRERGAKVEAYDLFPELFDVEGMTCRKADLSKDLPIASGYADLVVCQEAIEHVPNQLKMLRELSRILKVGGRLVLSTPNVSNLRAKLSNFLVESELYKRLPPNELDAVWLSSGSAEETYFGHLFLVGIQRLRVLARIAGFRLMRVHPVKLSGMSLFLGVFYPLIALASWRAYRATMRKSASTDLARKREVYGEIRRLNLNPTVLFGKKLFVEFEKEKDPQAMSDVFRENRDFVMEHVERQKRLDAEEEAES